MIYGTPLGVHAVSCLPQSDTIVGVPLRVRGSHQCSLESVPYASGDSSYVLTIDGLTGLVGGEFAGTHYLKFNSGALEGRFFAITANSADTVTILNSDDLSGGLDSASPGDDLLIACFWTLDSLFPPDQATTGWTESPAGSGNWKSNGHAVVASTGGSAFGRRSEILLPDCDSEGINLAPNQAYYIDSTSGDWESATGSANAGGTILWPDTYLVIRHRPLVAHATKFKSGGEVEMGSFRIPLFTLATGFQDNFIALPRPVALRLDELGLAGTEAFVSSLGASVFGRRDQILVFDNEAAHHNKSASEVYYHDGTNWVRSSDQSVANDAILPAGDGFIIRKFRTSEGQTRFWANPAPY